MKNNYTPRPSFAFTRSSFDRQRRHLLARIGFVAPQLMQIFLFNNRFSASGNLAMSIRLLEHRNRSILFKDNSK